MMWIVRLALNRTYTFVVMAMLIGAVSVVSMRRMSTDIFPEINIPVVSVVWQYTGMPADEIEKRIILVNERVLTTSVNDIEHIESQSLFGVGVIRIYFQPGAKIEAAVAQVTATSQAILKIMPPGINPPYIVQYSATSVPIVQIAVSSDTLPEEKIFDYAANFVIQRLGTVQGARVPQPWGGKWPQVMVDLDPQQLYARGLSPQDVQTAINSQNLIVPSGTAKIGDTEYYVKLNSSPDAIAAFNEMPIKTINGVPIYVKDVANVHMGYQVQTNVVRRDGRRAVLMTILKGEGASSVDVVNRVRAAMPGIQAQVPPELKVEFLFDQSVFVKAAIDGVIKEGAIAAGLTAMMILLFLGSWRSTIIVATSIPLSILSSVIVLWALGQSLNIMTLGGLALAVGILVDDATVELENTHRNFGANKPIRRAILDAASQIATPALVSTLAICIVFIPVLFLSGPAASPSIPWRWRLSSPCSPRTSCRGPWCRRWCCTCCPRKCRSTLRKRPACRPPPAARSGAFTTASTIISSGCVPLTRDCSGGRSRTVSQQSRRCSASPPARCCWCPAWARTSSPPSMPVNSGCTFGHPPARASSKPNACSARSSR